ncbi:hypothetical protein L6164_030408 [Bauhinia variegata]|uniref:Uncharacterized protein n=1 Tax=Bauhinia variegata TaxID=167791 RepID=A0ACB9LBP8_BAUVA|nr:hypothetical protein L6164_030408 [Bauhinia variegata]
MDREPEEMQFLGVVGVYKEAYKIINSWKKIFNLLTLSLILPLSFVFLFHIEVSHLLIGKIESNAEEMSQTQEGTPRYQKLSDLLPAEWAYYFLFQIAYLIFFITLSLLSTSAVVYTIASIYTARDVTFKNVMSVVPKVWHRLFMTFLCTFVAFLAINLMAVAVILIWVVIIGITNASLAILGVLSILYIVGILYLSIVWQLSNVVSVLEESYGFLAMIKSRELIKGKMWLASFILLTLNLSFFLVKFSFEKLVVNGWKLGAVDRTIYGIICFLLISNLFLFSLVLQTLLYFVCKSYHHENIDKSVLSDRLDVYLGEYEPLKTKDVQLEQCHV